MRGPGFHARTNQGELPCRMERFEAKLDYLCSPRAKQDEFVCRTDHSGVKLPTCVPNKADLPAELTIRSSNSPSCVHLRTKQGKLRYGTDRFRVKLVYLCSAACETRPVSSSNCPFRALVRPVVFTVCETGQTSRPKGPFQPQTRLHVFTAYQTRQTSPPD